MHSSPVDERGWAHPGGWAGLLRDLANQAAAMAAQFVDRVYEIPEYASAGIAREDLLATAEETFAHLVTGLQRGDRMLADGPARAARELGGRRARAGIPAESLTSAVRLDFPVMWAQLLALADPADRAVLTSCVEEVWNLVDQYAAQTRAGYLDERVRMAQEEAVVERDFIAQLFASGGLGPENLHRIGTVLHLDAQSSLFLAAALDGAGAMLSALGATPPSLARVYVYKAGGVVYAFGKALPGNALPSELATIPCGLVRAVPGLAGLREAAGEAEALARAVGEGDAGPLDLLAGWPRVVRRLLDDARLPLRTAVDEALAGCRRGERDRLEETALSLLETGNVTATAAALFCHRNTILNRMTRFRQLTGIDLAVPAQAARLVVAWA